MGRIVEIGSLREPVEVLDEPRPAPEKRTGRIKHRNGENVAISFETLQALMDVARAARRAERSRRTGERPRDVETTFPA